MGRNPLQNKPQNHASDNTMKLTLKQKKPKTPVLQGFSAKEKV